ncbi:MAG: RimK/LysX family protein [Hydrogenovibrio sp.]|uniref:ATP-dependent zinc protease family protein n=1 Tax=Hydrogenovibrio sp. TaxID=2065821 RepID=UPI0028709BB0|nr:RimK/LysX family protein [Hydrogenovibrio sp.]MDR9499399.1 RimK/LysX family protein [Hydrogenovibrio sp.]
MCANGLWKRWALLGLAVLLSGCQSSALIKQADVNGIEQSQHQQAESMARVQATTAQALSQLDALALQVKTLQEQASENRVVLSRLDQRQEAFFRLGRTLMPVALGGDGSDQSKSKSSGSDNQNSVKMEQKAPYRYVEGKLVVGSVEKAHLLPSNWLFLARIDSGAETSSLDARNIRLFERDGQEWVKFELADRQYDRTHPLELPVQRIVRILQSSSDEPERRPVVAFKLTLGDIEQVVEFTLSDRSHLEYAMLIGRNVLKDLMLIDVSQQQIAPPSLSRDPSVPESKEDSNDKKKDAD